MTQNRDSSEVGRDIASILLEWRPRMSTVGVASAIMSALERYSIETEGSGETGLLGCMTELQERFEKRRMSI